MTRNVLKSSIQNASFSIIFQVKNSFFTFNQHTFTKLTVVDSVSMYIFHSKRLYNKNSGARCSGYYECETSPTRINHSVLIQGTTI